jgi:murein DD-endopeptidase MepM/ murein hydrolase activator NlpD
MAIFSQATGSLLKLNNMIKRILTSLLLIYLLLPGSAARAQDTPPPSGPIYIIQPGDSLSLIASRFGVSLDDLMAANNMSDANNISAGAQIIIPGLEGINGVLVTQILNYGETLHSLSRRNRISEAFLRKLNHITSPSELYAGAGIVLPQQTDANPLNHRATLNAGESLLEAAIRAGSDPWTLQQVNSLNGTWEALPGEVLYSPSAAAETSEPNGMPTAFASVTVTPLPMTQGGTSEIIIQSQPGVTLGGSLADMPLHFFPQEDGSHVALQGLHAMLEPGPYPLELEATLPDGSKQSYQQMVIVQSGYYPNDPLLLVDPATIDPAVTEPEFQQLTQLTAPATPTRYWQGKFQSPASFTDCFTSRYGNRRIYQGQGTDQQIQSFHSGLDFCGGEGLPITAPADGLVVFAGPLTVRGNATLIDHGWGVYSGFWHQSEIKVQTGQTVKQGEVIGLVGGTGRVTGAHQHWEVWVNGVQVNPMNWLDAVYP